MNAVEFQGESGRPGTGHTVFATTVFCLTILSATVGSAAGPPGSDREENAGGYRAPVGTAGHRAGESGGAAAAPSAARDPEREAAWQRARAEANRRVREFESALQSGDPARIRRSALDLQSDPLAIHHINRNRPDLVEANNQVVREIRTEATRQMREAAAREWNRANPDKPPVTADDVEIYQPRNWRSPDAPATSPQDWDVTVRVRGQDLPPSRARRIVEESFYHAAGGEQTFGKGATPESVARRQRVETTSGRSPEAYNEPQRILGTPDAPPRPGEPLRDPEQLTRAIEHKSNAARNESDAARGRGDPVQAAHHEFDQMYQAAKQYERITRPRVEAAGGRVDPRVEEGMRILGQVGPDGISPEEARARLAQMGETPESIIRKASGQAEAAQVLGRGRGTQADTPEGAARGATDAPEGRARGPSDAPEAPPRGPSDTPDRVPGRVGKALETVGKGMQAVDILAGADDAKKAIQDGDMGKLRDSVVNTADGLAGGPLATGRMLEERLGKNRTEKNEAQEQARQAAEAELEQRMRVELRQSGLSKAEVEAIMEARARGDDRPLRDAYERAGRTPPKGESPDPGWRDSLNNYGSEVVANTKEVAQGIADRAEKAKNFVTQTGRDLAEIGAGLTEKGVARELIEKQKDNLTKDNLKAGVEHLAEKGKELIGVKETDREREGRAAQDLAEKLIEKGVDPETARRVAGDYITHAGGKGTRGQLRDVLESARSSSKGGISAAGTATEGGSREKDARTTSARSGPQKERTESARERPPDREVAPSPSPPTTAGRERGPSKEDREAPRNDAGERVDAGQYRDGDTIVVRDGTEYVKQGDRWEKTGRNYGSYTAERGARGGLAGAEPAAGATASRGDASSRAGGLGGLIDGRSEKTSAQTQGALGLMGGQQNLAHASTRGDAAARDARTLVDAAGREAHTSSQKSAADVASANREGGWGKAVADGVQQAVEKGLTAAGQSLGKAAADAAANSIFKDGQSAGGAPATGASAGSAPVTASAGGASARGATRTVSSASGGSSRGARSHGGGGRGEHRDSSRRDDSASGAHDGTTLSGEGTGGVTVTCPGCGKPVKAAPGESVQCPYCVTMNCPRCGYSKNYPRGQEPESCPMCYTTTCGICGRTGWARRDRPAPQCPHCIRIRCSRCGSLLYQGDRASAPASLPCETCTARAKAEAGKGN
ncbi:MAG: hypothetical protein N2652_07670 [Kiritimatiellae bacterium]|nr:hypothetical protein [Kiritimatiellia bacterium]